MAFLRSFFSALSYLYHIKSDINEVSPKYFIVYQYLLLRMMQNGKIFYVKRLQFYIHGIVAYIFMIENHTEKRRFKRTFADMKTFYNIILIMLYFYDIAKSRLLFDNNPIRSRIF